VQGAHLCSQLTNAPLATFILPLQSPALFSIMTIEPNGIVDPVHEKAMPVILMTAEDVDRWLNGSSVEDALAIQRPAANDALAVGPPVKPEKKKAA